jgi:electron transport complex protein RnfC
VESVVERIARNHFWKFHGGIHPPEQKFLSNDKPIKQSSLPKQLIIPLQQHIGNAGELIVNVGDYVLKGQALTKSHHPMAIPVHASTSGTITDIKLAVVPHPSAMPEMCVFIKPDGLEKWRERKIQPDYQQLSRHQIISKIADAGISGMGGAGFPTHIKVSAPNKIKFLIINAAECEPYITSDDLLMREQSSAIVDGIKILDHLLQAENILIGIEDNKPEAITALKNATAELDHCHVCVLPTKYPTGGEKQLIKILTGIEVLKGTLPIHSGIVMQNVATCFAIANAVINDTPLIQRVVTITGQAVDKPQNIWALIGTPIKHLLAQCGYHADENSRLIMGGPMMGFSLPSANIPIIKTSNCIIAPTTREIPNDQHEVECIRCGQCAEVCPAQLLPQELQWAAKAKDNPQLNKLNLFDCIECGACAYVCPSQIPLVHYYRIAKADIREQQVQEIKAEKAKQRFEARKQRLEQEKLKRELKHKQAAQARKEKMNSGTTEGQSAKSAVAAALARVKAKKNNQITEESSVIEKKEAIKNSLTQQTKQTISTAESNDDKKSQVAAAIARAKAKKLAKANTDTDVSADKISAVTETTKTTEAASSQAKIGPTSNVSADNKKAKIAAAILKAKQKAEQKAGDINKTESTDNAQIVIKQADSTTAEKQEAIQTPAISTSKANKDEDNSANLSREDKIKAAVAKAKQRAQLKAKQNHPHSDKSNTIEAIGESTITTIEKENSTIKNDVENDDRAKRIAAAIAKAKAKKQQVETN